MLGGRRGGILLQNMLTNGGFDNGLTGWLNNGGMASYGVTSGILSFTCNAFAYFQQNPSPNSILGHKYYMACKLKTTSAQVQFETFQGFNKYATAGISDYQMLSFISTAPATRTDIIRVVDRRASGYDVINVDWMIMVDLTNTFCGGVTGTNNEPNLSWCDANLSSYFDKLII